MREKEELVRLIDLFLLVDSNFDKTTATRNALRQLKHAISMNRKKEIQRLIRDELQAMLAKIANQSKDDLPLVNNLSSSDVADMLLCTFAKLLPLNVLENNYPIDIISMEKILNQDRFVSSTGYLFTLSHLAHYQCELAKGKKVIKHFVDPLINSPFLSARDEARLWLMLSKLKPKTKAKVKHQALSRIFQLPWH